MALLARLRAEVERGTSLVQSWRQRASRCSQGERRIEPAFGAWRADLLAKAMTGCPSRAAGEGVGGSARSRPTSELFAICRQAARLR
jgi:hypothetical protein